MSLIESEKFIEAQQRSNEKKISFMKTFFIKKSEAKLDTLQEKIISARIDPDSLHQVLHTFSTVYYTLKQLQAVTTEKKLAEYQAYVESLFEYLTNILEDFTEDKRQISGL